MEHRAGAGNTHVARMAPPAAAWERHATSLAPLIVATAYPWLLQLAHMVATQRQSGGLSELVARAILAGALMFVTPAAGLWLVLRLSRPGGMTLGDLRLRAVATVVLATPPLFTFVGVEVSLAGIAHLENAVWLAIWLPLAVAAVRTTTQDSSPAPHAPPRAAWRITHGIGALLLLSGFIGLHLANHVFGLVSAEAHLRFMHVLRYWYRNGIVEPTLLALCALQLATGALLARRWLARAVDAARALQAATGAYLGLYLACHLNSVFFYARAQGIETDFWFASGGRAGLMMGGAWDTRLVPHYALAVVFLFVHLGAGFRVVLLAHGHKPRWIMHAAWSIGVLAALGAVLPLLRIHLA
jgi:hypothetical protein